MRKILRNGFIHALAGAALVTVVGCAQGTGDSNTPDQPQTLRDIEIPQDFTFATSRAVSVTVSAAQATIGADTGALEVARADGRVLYRGPLSVSQPLTLNLAIPTKDDVVKLRLSANGQEHTAEVALGADGATHAF
jgi:hypothetical protein